MAARRSSPRGYTRIDQPENNNHGWFVRVGYYKRRDGTWKARHVRFFGDFTYGGKTKARKAAEAFVKKVQREARKEAKAMPARKAARTATKKAAARRPAKKTKRAKRAKRAKKTTTRRRGRR